MADIKVAAFFETKVRAMDIGGKNGETFVTLKDDAPDWLKEAVRDCHDGMLPNDWIFAECEAVCVEWDSERFDGRYWQDAVYEFVSSRVDIYTSEVFKWAADFCNSSIFAEADEQSKELGGRAELSIEKVLQSVQHCALETIAFKMIGAIRKNTGKSEDGEDE